MAFVKKVGSRYQVRQGNNNRLLATKGSRAAAVKEVKRLHAKNKPRGANRGASARKKQGKAARRK